MRYLLASALICVLCASRVFAQAPTVGLITHDHGSLDSGYVLFAPSPGHSTLLIDKCGKEIHRWKSTYLPGQSVYLLADGSILHTGLYTDNGNTGSSLNERIDWNGTVRWHYLTRDSSNGQHHDIEIMPNGNLLLISRDVKSADSMMAVGRDPSGVPPTVWSEKITEIKPIGADSAEIVWEWRVWDHLIQDVDHTKPNFGVVGDHPELININYATSNGTDWLHFNSVRYNAAFDQIMVSSHNFGEVWIIDHGTTTAEARSHAGGRRHKGGDLIYRWGNPAAYFAGPASSQVFFAQHDCNWIPAGMPHAGSIMVFNNGVGRTGSYSSIERFTPAVDAEGNYTTSSLPYPPASVDWTYTDSPLTSFYCQSGGSAQPLANGNVLICDGQGGTFFEIDSSKNKVWKYINPVIDTTSLPQGAPVPHGIPLFRAVFYPHLFPAFAGRTLPAGAPLETNPVPYSCTLDVDSTFGRSAVREWAMPHQSEIVYPNPTRDRLVIAGAESPDRITIVDALGRTVLAAHSTRTIETGALPAGVYSAKITRGKTVAVQQFVVVH